MVTLAHPCILSHNPSFPPYLLPHAYKERERERERERKRRKEGRKKEWYY
jgi:hypothetical protein